MYPTDFLASIAGCLSYITLDYGLPLSLFLAGLIGSTTHCVFMCGPFVVSQTGDMKKIKDAALIPYHLGRMTTYIFMAVLTYSILNLVFVYSDLKTLLSAPLLFLAATIFMVSAFPQLKNLFPWVQKFSLPSTFVHKYVTSLNRKNNILNRYILGVLLGFMPCALVVAALIASTSAPNLLMAAFSMGMFTLGTVPALVLLALGGGSLKKKYPRFSVRFSQSAKILCALWLSVLACTLVL